MQYKVVVEIDEECEEIVDVCGLDYIRSEDDDSQIVVWLTLNDDEFFDIFERNELLEEISERLLNAEIAEFTNRITVYKPQLIFLKFLLSRERNLR